MEVWRSLHSCTPPKEREQPALQGKARFVLTNLHSVHQNKCCIEETDQQISVDELMQNCLMKVLRQK